MTTVSAKHRCLLCVREIPLYRALCRSCFDRVPWALRADLLQAWRNRIIDPIHMQDQLARVHLWDVDSRAIPGLRERTAG